MPVLIVPSTNVDQSLLGGGGYVLVVPNKPAGVVQGTWTPSIGATGFCCNSYSNETTHADGDEIYYYIMLSAGTYTFQAIQYCGNNSAIVKYYLDAALIATHDQYVAIAETAKIIETTGIVVGASKLFKLTMKADGKNAGSSNYYARNSAMIFMKTA